MKSICLKIIYEYYNLDMVLTAYKIKEKKLLKNVFQIPKYNVLVEGNPTKWMPSANVDFYSWVILMSNSFCIVEMWSPKLALK